MTGQVDFSKPYWFYLSSEVYISENKAGSKILLYHTQSGENIEVCHPSCIHLIKAVYESSNLGVVRLPSLTSDKQELVDFIETVMLLKMGGLVDIVNDKNKPINLLPFLSLSNDIEKLEGKDETSLAVPNLISYLSELNVYINGECAIECSSCSRFFTQTKSCTKSCDNEELDLNLLRNILDQIVHSSVKKINIIGGDILKYSYWHDLLDLINEYEFDFHLWYNYQHLSNESITKNIIPDKVINEILVTFPVQKISFEIVAQKYCSDSYFHFFAENKRQYDEYEYLIEHFKIGNSTIEPIYTGDNVDFFSEFVFIEKEDIFSSVISIREIFRNQKLNANNFGALIILPDGSVKANINSETIGNIRKDSILELIYKELTGNSSWRVIRNNDVCNNCLYQFLCPPPSNYETVIGRPNLCHIKFQ